MKNKELNILLSAPRGFCAGVERAIEIVEKSIQKYGAPVYVRHEIVHNKFVVDDLKKKGASLDKVILVLHKKNSLKGYNSFNLQYGFSKIVMPGKKKSESLDKIK